MLSRLWQGHPLEGVNTSFRAFCTLRARAVYGEEEEIGEQSYRGRTDFLLYLSSFRAECIVVSGVVFITFCLQKYATFYVRAVRMAHVSTKCAPGAILQQANGDIVTFCLPSRLSRVRAPSPAPFVYIVSLLTGEKPLGDDQAVLGKARRRCFCVHKGVQ